jgi:CHASE2 domain-containing sensor protein
MHATARRSRLPALLAASLVAGALYDAGFAVLMVAAPRPIARLLRLPLPPLPEAAFYLWIMAVLLLMLAACYLLAARDPRRYAGVVAVAIAGRALGGVTFIVAARGHQGLAGLYPLAAADLGFGLAHAACWRPVRS